jgi:hypothetical protein
MAGFFDKLINRSVAANAGSEPETSDEEITDELVEDSAASGETRTLKKIREAIQELLKYGLLEEASKPNLYRVVLTHPEEVTRILEPLIWISALMRSAACCMSKSDLTKRQSRMNGPILW